MISWIVNGIETVLDDRDTSILLAHDGFGMPDFHRLEERGPQQHGVTDRGYRLDARTINLALGINGSTLAEFYQKRSELLNIFKPSNTPGVLKWEHDGVVRQIRGFAVGGLQYSGNDQEYLYQKAVVTIKCPDPTWYDPTGVGLNFTMGGGDDTFEVPTVIPMTVGASSIDDSQSIDYEGTVEAYPTIRIDGPITNPVISNDATGDKLDFTGYTISGSDYYIIDLLYGYKTVLDSSGVNKISELSNDSDLATFSIKPDPDVVGGINSIHVTGTSITADTRVSINFYERYLGI